MALSAATCDAIRRDWTERLDCDPKAFETAAVTVTERPGRTVRLLQRDDATVVAAPNRVSEALRANLDSNAAPPLADASDVIREALTGHATDIAEVHGPAVLGYVDADTFSPVVADARLLESEDEAAFEGFRARVPAHEWRRASPTFRPGRTAGLCRDGELVAVATLSDRPFPDVGVVVDPAWRGEGLGRRVVSAVVAVGFERAPDAVVRYRTPADASDALALAASLGFEQWATELVAVLDDAQSGGP